MSPTASGLPPSNVDAGARRELRLPPLVAAAVAGTVAVAMFRGRFHSTGTLWALAAFYALLRWRERAGDTIIRLSPVTLVAIFAANVHVVSSRYLQLLSNEGEFLAAVALAALTATGFYAVKARLAPDQGSTGSVAKVLAFTSCFAVLLRLVDVATILTSPAPPSIRGQLTYATTESHKRRKTRPNAVGVLFAPDHGIRVEVSAETLAEVIHATCLDVELRPGLLGFDWCVGDCVRVASSQQIPCNPALPVTGLEK